MPDDDRRRRQRRRVTLFRLLSAMALAGACEQDLPPAPAAVRPAVRVVPACAAATDYLTWLDCRDRLVALPEQALDHAAGIDAARDLAALPRFAAFRAEALLAHRPDLVVCDWYQAADTRAALQATGVRVVVLAVVRDWPDIAANLRLVGKALDVAARAEAAAADWERRVAALLAAPPANAPLVLPCFDHGTGARTAGSGTIEDLAIRLAGARNLARELGLAGHVMLPIERVLTSPPDWLLTGEEGQRAALFASPSLATLSAVRDRKLLSLPKVYRDATSPYVLDGAAHLRRALHGPARTEGAR